MPYEATLIDNIEVADEMTPTTVFLTITTSHNETAVHTASIDFLPRTRFCTYVNFVTEYSCAIQTCFVLANDFLFTARSYNLEM